LTPSRLSPILARIFDRRRLVMRFSRAARPNAGGALERVPPARRRDGRAPSSRSFEAEGPCRGGVCWLPIVLEAVLALALPACVALAAPEYLVDSWQTERGLPQNTVKAILQTRDGYLWVGTYDGLARFDGVQFTVFTVANAPGLGSSDITRLCEDREGRLWIGTVREGLACYQNGEFTPGPGNEVGKARSIQGVVQARDGSLLVLTVDGVFRLKAREWEPIAVPGQDFTRVKAYGYLGQNSAGDVWMQMDEGLYRYADGRMNLRESFDVPIMTLGVDPDGAALCGLQGGRVAEVPVVGPVRYTDFSPARFA